MNATYDEIESCLTLRPLRVHDERLVRTVMLTGIRPTNPAAPRGEQTRDVLEQMERGLAEAGLKFSHVIRTWFYLKDILGWYGEFNQARTAFFEERGVFKGLLPASTGIGIDKMECGLTAAVLAVEPLSPKVRIREIESPLQCPAPDYRSSFSRAVEVASPAGSRMYISGTASIAPDGQSVYAEDVDKQIDLTCKVIQAMLESRRMGWAQVTRAVAYFRDGKDIPKLAKHLKSYAIPEEALHCVEATVCRDELLFELELDAET